MPVLILAGSSAFGRAVCEAFLETGGQVRAYSPVDDETLRSSGVHLAVGDWLDVQRLESALAQVHTLVHLTGPAVRHPRDEAEALEVSAIAAHAAGVPRVLVLLDEGRSRKQRRAIETGLGFFAGTDCEVIVVRVPAGSGDAIPRLLLADARP